MFKKDVNKPETPSTEVLVDHVFTTKVVFVETNEETPVQVYMRPNRFTPGSGTFYAKSSIYNNMNIGHLSYDTFGDNCVEPYLQVSYLNTRQYPYNKICDKFKYVGSILIEAAFVTSINFGCEGRLELESEYGSWPFYIKGMGFSCKGMSQDVKDNIDNYLKNKKGRIPQEETEAEMNNVDMFLSREEIERKKFQYGLFKSNNNSTVSNKNDVDEANDNNPTHNLNSLNKPHS